MMMEQPVFRSFFQASFRARPQTQPRVMLGLLVGIAVTGCGGGDDRPIDAAIDALPMLDCPTYCSEVQANCTGADAQYSDMDHCAAACKSFAVGTSTVVDKSGNTLGCRIYHAGAPSKMAAATHCPHAGPAGDLIPASAPAFCSGGDLCASFCTLEILACGSLDAPLPDNPKDETGNPLFQYQNLADCMRLCPSFDKTHVFSTSAVGNSLACRLNAAISAAISVTPNAKTYCAYTAEFPTGACAGTASP